MIRVDNLTKSFKLYKKPMHRLVEALFGRQHHHLHVALDDISFQIERGDTLGIIGCNGAGKSTLLKILMGVMLPDSGRMHIDGKVTGLLELGTGFEPEMSGLENIHRNALLLGMTDEEIARKQDAIIDFSELGEYIKEPLRTYSSGMVMRLAFSVAIHADPGCFLVDEALSVGDAHFQQKSLRRIQEFRRAGGSIVFVSHDMNAVKVVCDRAIVLDGGRIVMDGSPDEAVNHYNQIVARLESAEGVAQPKSEGLGYGTREVEVLAADLKGEGSGVSAVSAGEKVHVNFRLKAHADLEDVTLGILIRDRFGRDVFGTNSHYMGKPIKVKSGQEWSIEFGFVMNLAPGKYTLTAALHSWENHLDNCYHWCDNLIRFEVAGVLGNMFYGVARLEPVLQIDLLRPRDRAR